MTRHRLETRTDFVERTIRAAPIRALAELIWNSLDADATDVQVTFDRNDFGGITAIEVRDNGSGMTQEQAVAGFRSLGGSWKDIEKQSRKLKRRLHGKQGRGRLLAFSLRGERVTWRTVGQTAEGHQLTTVTVTAGERDYFEASEGQPTNEPVGTLVRVDGISDTVPGVEGNEAWLDLLAEFALYVEQYRPVVALDGRPLDPAPLQSDRAEFVLEDFDRADPPLLTVVEWKIPVKEVLYLCDSAGVALDFVRAPRAPLGIEYTAYLRWHGIEERSADLALADGGGHPVLGPLVDAARKQLSAHLEQRRRERQRTVIEEWQREKVYPFEDGPTDRIAVATRDLFDVVAVAAATAVNSTEDKKSRRMSLTLLRQALEREPGSAYEVLREVLDLPETQLESLRHLLRRTTLTAIIKASRSISDRLDFLAALRLMVFDEEIKKSVRERSELHRMLENETWVFGEQFSLTASDKGLTAALAAHIKLLGRDELNPEPVVDSKGVARRLDLMLARNVPHARKEHEHLVVELKAPSVVIGDTEISQIRNYARTVAADPRFDRLEVQWDFILVSTELDASARAEASQRDRAPGLVSEYPEGIRVWVRSWAEVIDDAEWRLNFVKERLGYAPTDEQALEYLRETYAEFLPDGLPAPEATEPPVESDQAEAAIASDSVDE